MIRVRRSNERGYADHGWLKSMHSFSFASYYDPKHMGFRTLKVINEDFIAGGKGFGSHPHRDMEIITYIISGALEHKDSMGNIALIRPGEVQRMTAGTGVVHSEFNAKISDETHLFQIWISPSERGGPPGYAQESFETKLNSEKLVLVVSGDGRDGSLPIKQDADMYISRLKAGDELSFQLRAGRGVWLQVASGDLIIAGESVKTGDAVAVESESTIAIKANDISELLIFDL